MKIALLGYGKMGQVIEKVALERGHTILLKKTRFNSFDGLENADIAIDFSAPEAAINNITTCINSGIPIVSGTTGWLHDFDKILKLCTEKKGTFIYSSNFSLGVNLFFELNANLAKMMSQFLQYKVQIEEVHHTQKLDAPSGTAISIANKIIENGKYKNWTLAKANTSEIAIVAKRIENVPGTHSVIYNSDIDSIEIKHTAHNREGFALGSIIAAEWLQDKKGVFTMKDVLNSKQ